MSSISVLQEKHSFFVIVAGKFILRDIFLKNAMEDAGYLCNEIGGTSQNCVNLQKLFAAFH